MFIVMGKDRVKVASAFLSEDRKSVSGFREDGSRVILLEGVNFENVWLENEKGERVQFQVKPNTDEELELADLKQQLKELTEKMQQMTEEKTVMDS
ncbi:hypothetical protein MOE47_09540 [Bacillus atrophaeus]|uniref:hypothetical protein n=1 Tax=Bacillus atrophaeus TaxID=1452 RepID=UPI00227E29D6|nr:hypothetical protein [Bacillus atrophaeus]MCY8913202.1 hypothetical protein [Bacillus atrophaeus]MCY9114650.1 hypothetical protein [Bacillus atrophaeus]MEC0924146.1 hypothetical protein [Bacillus atrophaeus]MEC0932757.1 hypothetical protein [Bacillus atrophaeus]